MTAATIFIVKTADESRFDETAGFIDDAELVLPLEAGAAYWIEACILGRASAGYATEIRGRLQYSGILYDPGMHLVEVSNNTYLRNAYELTYRRDLTVSQSGLDGYSVIRNSSSSNTTYRGMMWFSGRITCTTAGDLRFNWAHWDNGFAGSSNPTVVYTGSFMYATPLDICPI